MATRAYSSRPHHSVSGRGFFLAGAMSRSSQGQYRSSHIVCSDLCILYEVLFCTSLADRQFARLLSQEEILANAMLLPSLHNAKVSIFLTYSEVQKQRSPDSAPAAILAELARLDKAAPDVCALYDAHL